MPFEEDLSLFLSADEFGVVATATTRYGEVVQFQVIFDNGYGAQFGGLADATQPTAQARSVDVADLEASVAYGYALALRGAAAPDALARTEELVLRQQTRLAALRAESQAA